MSHRNNLTNQKPNINRSKASGLESAIPKRKPARDFFTAERVVLVPEQHPGESPVQQVMDEWVIPTLAKAFLSSRGKNTVKNKPTSQPLRKEL